MSKADKISGFDPNAPADNDQLFGLPFTAEESDLIAIGVPWDVTTSYGSGTASAPNAILEASWQVDLYDPFYPDFWKRGAALSNLSGDWDKITGEFRQQAEALRNNPEDEDAEAMLNSINRGSELLNAILETAAGNWLDQGKIVGVLGGDHSSPLGLMRALAKRHSSFGILQIDAHLDLRLAYEGFINSHASIMYNAWQLEQVQSIVSVGIRDFCHEEQAYVDRHADKLKVHTMRALREAQFEGGNWHQQCQLIIDQLPDKVYVSFDIDGLDPALCPNTGTPVPDGLQFEEAAHLLRLLALSGKTIIGFDLCEVTPGQTEWDANVGARMLFQLAVTALRTNRSND